MQKLFVLALLVAAASASAIPSVFLTKAGSTKGVVTPIERCEGNGTPVQLRVSDCEGKCEFTPGTPYLIEGDFMPSAAFDGVSMKLIAISAGVEYPVVDEAVPNSNVEPGTIYTIKYTLTPTTLFSGKTITLQLQVYPTGAPMDIEICIRAEVDIL